MYWIVFDVVFNTRSEMVSSGVEVPYVLFLTTGLVPWFYFSEAITNGTNALLEYSYLVKKVVFNISILPIIKLIAATFIHIFFVGVLIVVSIVYGCYPTWYTLQVVYYSFCLFMLVLAMSYCTCAVVVFFPGSCADHQYRASGRNVGDPDSVEYRNDRQRPHGHACQAESAGVYCERLSECDIWR